MNIRNEIFDLFNLAIRLDDFEHAEELRQTAERLQKKQQQSDEQREKQRKGHSDDE